MPIGRDRVCTACEPRTDWPCHVARARLLDDLATDRVTTTMYLASSLVKALEDLPGVPAGLLYGRFVGWTR
jgi:hypothetical protein